MHNIAESSISKEEGEDTRKGVKQCTERDSRTETSVVFPLLSQSGAGLG